VSEITNVVDGPDTGSDGPDTGSDGPDTGSDAELDAAAAAAVEVARRAAEEIAPAGTVGEHLGVSAEGERLVLHSFACTAPGYRGWHWAVSLARAPQAEQATVCDTVLLPGPDAVLARSWLPWSDRVRPGDLGPGDELPYRADDENLAPAYTVSDPDEADELPFMEIGLGRERVLGLHGLQAAAERWAAGAHGPTADVAIQAAAPCLTCGYFLPIAGLLRGHFGVCANEWSPSDGMVVTVDHGCGAHSQTDLEPRPAETPPPPILDDNAIELVVPEPAEEAAEEVAEEAASDAEPIAGTDAAAEVASDPSDLPAEPTAEVEPEAVAEPAAELASDAAASPMPEGEQLGTGE
jgi:hypothetical protein